MGVQQWTTKRRNTQEVLILSSTMMSRSQLWLTGGRPARAKLSIQLITPQQQRTEWVVLWPPPQQMKFKCITKKIWPPYVLQVKIMTFVQLWWWEVVVSFLNTSLYCNTGTFETWSRKVRSVWDEFQTWVTRKFVQSEGAHFPYLLSSP